MSGLLDDEDLLDLRGRAKATDPAAVLAEERRRRAATPAPRRAEPPVGSGPSPTEAQAAASAVGAPGAASGVSACAICGTRKARGTCTMCGRPACAADLWVMLRLCRACADERAVERGQRGARPEASNWLEGPP